MNNIISIVFREQLQRKTIYIIAVIALVFTVLLISQTGGGLKINGKSLTTFSEMLPVGIALVTFFSSVLSIFLSMNTIPREFERKTSHLILVRPVKRWQYILGLTVGNGAISLLVFSIMSISLIIFILTRGRGDLALKIIPVFGMLAINISILSTVVSIISIRIPSVFAGLMGMAVYVLGILYDKLAVLASLSESIFLKGLMFLLPNILGVQQQAAAFLQGGLVEWRIIISSLIYLYIILWACLFVFPEEV